MIGPQGNAGTNQYENESEDQDAGPTLQHPRDPGKPRSESATPTTAMGMSHAERMITTGIEGADCFDSGRL